MRQLGFSEFIFPGATHTRFAHSIGVFHVARALMRVIRRHIDADSTRQFGYHQAKVALAAALVHDVGHGMFSHAFEAVGKSLNLAMAKHENVSEAIIRDSEITWALNRDLGGGLARRVACARSRDAALRRSSRSTSIVGCHQPRAKSARPGVVHAGQVRTSSAWLGLR